MKRRDLERILVNLGFQLVSQSKHTKWSNGNQSVLVPHGNQVNRILARRLLKDIGADYRAA